MEMIDLVRLVEAPATSLPNIMPSYLDFLKSRTFINKIYAATASALAIVLALLGWWARRKLVNWLARSSASCQTYRPFPLRQPDQARTDFAAIESALEVIQKQLARLPTHRELPGIALGIIFATA